MKRSHMDPNEKNSKDCLHRSVNKCPTEDLYKIRSEAIAAFSNLVGCQMFNSGNMLFFT